MVVLKPPHSPQQPLCCFVGRPTAGLLYWGSLVAQSFECHCPELHTQKEGPSGNCHKPASRVQLWGGVGVLGTLPSMSTPTSVRPWGSHDIIGLGSASPRVPPILFKVMGLPECCFLQCDHQAEVIATGQLGLHSEGPSPSFLCM